ncbi:hypothetical protein SISNIDRAFT_467519 [Sistotremastrum niveocremeum HHB9708]|uniref:DUF6535 domain-containing protein n=1 Tax=Sistotremastrum niveocremeum HHB9708 TaxID=1314777 RepID=A0A164SKX2_9AGAM|nr:hypothetical protein SISNIDRAFT_467519 [Sistotremastrum niveocremeum HHB9708]
MLTKAKVDGRARGHRSLTDEQTWGALFKESESQIKSLAKPWKERLNISLIFNFLFAIFLAFYSSPITLLIPPVSSLGNAGEGVNQRPIRNPVPPDNDQLVTLFYFISLSIDIFNFALCLLSLQCISPLTSRSNIHISNLSQTLLLESQRATAIRTIPLLISFLSLSQTLSIALFLTGFLLQYWVIITSFDLRAPILIFGGSFASFLAGLIAALHLLTTLHAIFYGRGGSLFENPFSQLVRKCVLWMRDLTRVTSRSNRSTGIHSTKKGNEDSDIENCGEPELGAVQQLLQRKATDSEDTVA